MKSAIQALLYMKEDHKYYHGDINLNKILNCNGTIKISEFLDFNIKNDKLELNSKKNCNSKTEKHDVYCLGMSILELYLM